MNDAFSIVLLSSCASYKLYDELLCAKPQPIDADNLHGARSKVCGGAVASFWLKTSVASSNDDLCLVRFVAVVVVL